MIKKLGAVMAAMMALSLAACGGGGEEEEDPDLGGDDDASGAGIWAGTYRIDGAGSALPMYGLVTDEGDFVMVAAGPTYRIFFGTGTTDGNSFSGNALSYNGPTKAPSSFQGTIMENVSITGSYALTGESALFTMQYNSSFTRGGSLTTLAGTYSFTLPASGGNPATTVTVDVQTSGSFMYTSSASGCTITGSFTVPHANRNYYRWTGNTAGCGATDTGISGVGYLGDVSAGQNKLLYMIGQNTPQTVALSLLVQKP